MYRTADLRLRPWIGGALAVAAIALVCVLGIFGRQLVERWWTPVSTATAVVPSADASTRASDDHSEAVDITPEAQRMMGLTLGQVKRGVFERTITLPAIIAQRPGQSRILLTTHLTGVVSGIAIRQGQVVEPGDAVCDIRLTHEEVIQAQADLLRSSRELDILKKSWPGWRGLRAKGPSLERRCWNASTSGEGWKTPWRPSASRSCSMK